MYTTYGIIKTTEKGKVPTLVSPTTAYNLSYEEMYCMLVFHLQTLPKTATITKDEEVSFRGADFKPNRGFSVVDNSSELKTRYELRKISIIVGERESGVREIIQASDFTTDQELQIFR